MKRMFELLEVNKWTKNLKSPIEKNESDIILISEEKKFIWSIHKTMITINKIMDYYSRLLCSPGAGENSKVNKTESCPQRTYD